MSRASLPPSAAQQGLTLVELMVAILIGVFIISVALGTLLTSRSISALLTEKIQLQQNASFSLQLIGAQIRPAGAYELARHSSNTAAMTFNATAMGANPQISGTASTLTVTAQTPNPAHYPSLLFDCTGAAVSGASITATFTLDKAKKALLCNGTPILESVTDFQVRYRNSASIGGGTNAPVAIGSQPSGQVHAIEVCLELTGTETVDTGSEKYTNCQGTLKSMGNLQKMVFRNVFDVRIKP